MDKIDKKSRMQILQKAYDNNWFFDEDDAKEMGLRAHREFLTMEDEGFFEWIHMEFGNPKYGIKHSVKKEVLDWLIEEEDNE